MGSYLYGTSSIRYSEILWYHVVIIVSQTQGILIVNVVSSSFELHDKEP